MSQIQNGQERVIAFGSKTLTKQQRRYCVTRRELLAVITFLHQFRHYLLGRKFSLRTDHSSLRWLINFKEPRDQLARWLEVISQYNVEILYREGHKHQNANAFSRIGHDLSECPSYDYNVELSELPCGWCKYCTRINEQWSDFKKEVDSVVPLSLNSDNKCRRMKTRSSDATVDDGEMTADHIPSSSWISGYSSSQISQLQKEDDELFLLHEWMGNGVRPERKAITGYSPAIRCYWLNWDTIVRKDGCLYRNFYSSNTSKESKRLQLLIPKKLRKEVTELCHKSLLSGHFGARRTVQHIKRQFYWYCLNQFVKLFVRRCDNCCKNKAYSKKAKAPLGDYRVGFPLDRIAIDIMGPLTLTDKGNKFIVVVGDYFTRWVEAYAIPDCRGETVANFLAMEFISRFGIPLEIHSDQAQNFQGVLFKQLCQVLQIHKTRTTPYHPASNGMIERFNRTLAELIRKYVNEKLNNWDLYLPFLTAAYRSTVHPSTGFSPNFMMFGREVILPVDMLFPNKNSQQRLETCEYVSELCDYDIHIADHKYSVGDLVYKKKFVRKKLDVLWVGPFVVVRNISDVVYEIKRSSEDSLCSPQ